MASKPVIRALKILLQGYNLHILWRGSEPTLRAFTMHPFLCEVGPDLPYAVVETLIEDGLVEGETISSDGMEGGAYWLSARGVQMLRHHAIGLKNYAETLLTTIDRSEWGISAPLDGDR